ncbi:class I tRNA ligase family protein [Flavobacterium piscis]|uniref:Leucine--tRNA ligase n=1 Tax=Flavobacterium piscis TaxID=1114874 RepID=A0ABU1Y687_9FLAO|nr:class I tRNA ligase family protein [Flavobacterium piscis]MDR7209738.1 leucyl-tRNA synthetase [Flavobacterium piscis]
MKYNPNEIDAKWQKYWAENQTFAAKNNSEKPKHYVLDMFPYPSGAGLHVGHPLGYIASDVYSRFKRHQGFNVLHPMGYDSFGLPAEQYAIQTGQRPEDTTRVNIDGGVDKEGKQIAGYRKQLDKIGFSFDWSREVRTSNPDYYKHTQWIFIQLFNSWYNRNTDKAEDISTLVTIFENEGNANVNAVSDDNIQSFSSGEWNAFSADEQEKILLQYRLTYLAETEVNWCPGLGTVLANDEIVNGVSERGGYPVIRKKMTQWSMRISAYAERLLQGLNDIDWSESIKESQRNWIGKSVGAMVKFAVKPHPQPLSSGEGSQAVEKGYMTANASIASQLVNNARENRKNSTEAEDILWQEVRNSNLGYKIRRQHYIGNFIVDFVCLEKKLIIEVDGGYHDTKEQIELDELRTLELEQKHIFKVIRFTNEEVLKDIESVLSKIKEELSLRNSFKDKEEQTPLSTGEGLGVRFIEVFTTRPDTIFGVTFMTLAPEHDLVAKITTPEQKAAVEAYIEKTAKRSERERMADVKTISGVFTGAYAEHPFTKEPIPVWIGDYVLAGYGTGAVMAVPCGDERDYAFANFFKGQNGMPEIKNIFANVDISEAAYGSKDNVEIANSDFLNGLNYKEATQKAIEKLEEIGQGTGKTNYRLRDAVFSRQRYWGEPFPVYYVNGLPKMIDAQHLPIILPEVEKYLPTEDGLPPLGNATIWAWDTKNNEVVNTDLVDNFEIFPLELNTMPGWAGSSWYWMRYMDAHNEDKFASKEALAYWESVDLYIGGSEHATGHLLYSRFWNKFLKDKGFAPTEEPFKKLINQGMILGEGAYIHELKIGFKWHFSDDRHEVDDNERIPEIYKECIPKILISYNGEDGTDFKKLDDYLNSSEIFKSIRDNYFSKIESEFPNSNITEEDKKIWVSSIQNIRLDINLLKFGTNDLDIERFRNAPYYKDFSDALIIDREGKFTDKYTCKREIGKMSKSWLNVVTPDDICAEYGADTLRLYEMFLGPLEQAKPWNTAGISGVFGFLKKLWRLYFDENNGLIVNNDVPTKDNLKSLHKTIKKVAEDIESFSFNTSVSQFMICVNELSSQNCHSRAILEPLAILVSPYAPHIAEELWSQLGHKGSISTVAFPVFDAKHLVESSKEYPVSFNGKMRFTIELPLDLTKEQIEEIIMKDERTLRQLDGKTPNKVIIVPGKIINLVG